MHNPIRDSVDSSPLFYVNILESEESRINVQQWSKMFPNKKHSYILKCLTRIDNAGLICVTIYLHCVRFQCRSINTLIVMFFKSESCIRPCHVNAVLHFRTNTWKVLNSHVSRRIHLTILKNSLFHCPLEQFKIQ